MFIIDVANGLFPESVPYDIKHADEEERRIYEEERRLFYVGITRAKNNLFLFRTQEHSIFIKQLLGKKYNEKDTGNQAVSKTVKVSAKINPEKTRKSAFDEELYNAFVYLLAVGVKVTHKKYGQGVISAVDETNVKILFDDMEKIFNKKLLFQNGMISI